MRGEPCEYCRFGYLCDHSPFGKWVRRTARDIYDSALFWLLWIAVCFVLLAYVSGFFQ